MQNRLVTLFLLLLAIQANGQSISYELPKIAMPSPAAQNFLRYGEIPIDKSTGIPNISVPIYTLKSRKIQFPITASYHAGGIKVGDRASVIGLGWVLNIKGVLAVTALGHFDFGTNTTTSKPSYTTAQAFNDARSVAGNTGVDGDNFRNLIDLQKDSKDWQSDRFSFQLPTGLSGVFRYDYLSGELLKLPFGSYKVDRVIGTHPTTGNPTTVGFTITDDKGDAYSFGYPPGSNYSYDYQSMDLLSIVSADKTDTISFFYKPGVGNMYDLATFGSVLEAGDDAYADPNSGMPAYQPKAVLAKVTNRVTTRERILDSIVSSSTSVILSSVPDRTDLGIYANGYRTNSITILDRYTRIQINEISFGQSYFGTPENHNLRLRLDNIAIKGSTSEIVDTYRFDYENGVQLPPVPEDDINLNPTFSEDYWGYFNGTSSYSKIPQEMITSSYFTSPYTGFTYPIPLGAGTNRNPNHVYAKAALIKSITYPTGGKTIFEFEPNYAANAYSYPGQASTGGIVGGFRIYQIKNYSDPLTLANVKTFQYSPGYTRTISSDLFIYSQKIFANVSVPFVVTGGAGPVYATVVDHTVYTSTPLLPLIYENGPPVFYEKVTEYLGDIINNSGKSEYTYLLPPNATYNSYDGPQFQNQYDYDQGNYTPALVQKTDYKNQEGQYFTVHKAINEYTTFKNVLHPTGVNLIKTTSLRNGIGYYSFFAGDTYFMTSNHDYNSYYHVLDMNASQAVNMLTKTKEYMYNTDGQQQMVTATEYHYDTSSHLQPIQIVRTNSKGEAVTIKYKYPVDYTGTPVYDNMISKNIISALINIDEYITSDLKQSIKNNYYDFGGNILAPKTIQVKKGTGNLETRIQYHNYDAKGNVLEVSKANDMKRAYLWGYNSTYPIAEVVNADNSSIAYSSFESTEQGNWNYSPEGHTAFSGSITGSNVYQLTSARSISRSGLLSEKNYLVTYWKNSAIGGSVSINGGYGGVPIVSKNGWTLYQKEIAGATAVLISGDGMIDELRLYPKNAQMTTYTYTPLIGITSQCDANDKIQYYEYDGFGRLQIVRDADGNILKTLKYNYKQ